MTPISSAAGGTDRITGRSGGTELGGTGGLSASVGLSAGVCHGQRPLHFQSRRAGTSATLPLKKQAGALPQHVVDINNRLAHSSPERPILDLLCRSGKAMRHGTDCRRIVPDPVPWWTTKTGHNHCSDFAYSRRLRNCVWFFTADGRADDALRASVARVGDPQARATRGATLCPHFRIRRFLWEQVRPPVRPRRPRGASQRRNRRR